MIDVIGILSFALHATHKVYDVIQTLKDAPNVVRALRREVSRVESLLTAMLPEPESNSGRFPMLRSVDTPLVNSLVTDAKELETAVEALLAKVTRQKEDGTHEIRKARWIFSARE